MLDSHSDTLICSRVKHGIIIIFGNIFNGFLNFYHVTNLGAGSPKVPHDWVDPVRKS
jgi:hypothetical protein